MGFKKKKGFVRAYIQKVDSGLYERAREYLEQLPEYCPDIEQDELNVMDKIVLMHAKSRQLFKCHKKKEREDVIKKWETTYSQRRTRKNSSTFCSVCSREFYSGEPSLVCNENPGHTVCWECVVDPATLKDSRCKYPNCEGSYVFRHEIQTG